MGDTPTADDLLPCPFCGQMPVITQTKNGVLVSCVEPKCPMDIVATYIDLSPSDVITAWNTRAEPRWIPVSERLPEENDAVLVVWKDGDIGLAFMHKDDWDYATHWMPMPEPPKGVEG